jgi:CRP-like cAMP-binding protein
MPDDTRELRLSMVASPRQNRLLSALDPSDYARLAPHFERVAMPLGMVLGEPGKHLDCAYFPATSIVSLLNDLEDGSSVEIAVAGNEGMVGIALFMGGGAATGRTVVRSAGHGWRLKASVLAAEFERGGSLRPLLLRYAQALLAQTAQTAACNRSHQLEQQLCRSLLASLDRLRSNEIAMTHERAASMLGVRRESVTTAAGKLQAAGVIRCSRGKVTVLDREALEARACECYRAVRADYDRLLPRIVVPALDRVAIVRRSAYAPSRPSHAHPHAMRYAAAGD